MKTKDYSRELCEICGIEPRYGVYEDFGDLDKNFQLVTNERKYRLIADTRYHYGVEDEDLRNLEPKYYPDFTEPENFVKLWEILSGQSRTEFLARLILRLKVEAGDFIYKQKQVIREQEWIYE